MKTVEVDIDFFTHLLGCMVDQKHLHLQPEETAKEKQLIIDKAYQDGLDFINPVIQKRNKVEQVLEKCRELITKDLVLIGDTIKRKSEDPKILTEYVLKWSLVRQECEMYCLIGEEIDKEDFEALCKDRGFDEEMRQYTLGVMKYVGLGGNLRSLIIHTIWNKHVRQNKTKSK